MINNFRKIVPLAAHVDGMLAPYRRGVPAIAAVFFSAIFGLTILISEMRADGQLLQAINAHVSSLVETQDRPELQRLLKSIADEKNSDVLVVEDGLVFASSRSLSELDQPYFEPKAIKLTSKNYLSTGGLLTKVLIYRHDGPKNMNAKIIMFSSLYSILLWSIFIAALVLCISLLLVSTFGEKLQQVIGISLKPVAELDEAIRSLKSLKDLDMLKPTGIQELESIREAILQTQQDLVNARDALAEKKAKELATEAYRRLIHDLHNPMAALGALIKLSNPVNDILIRREAAEKIPVIAGQIMNQISAAKSNIDFETEILREEDIRDCVEDATEQARLAASSAQKLSVEKIIPNEPIILAHDSKLLRRAVNNLVKNAIEASQSKVRVVIKKMAKEISIQVQDDGPGLSQDQAGLFLQGRKKSTKGDRQAFGLAAANHIVRIHGGRIIYRPSELGGACFDIRI